MKKITIIGAGNGGQAIAGYCASRGVEVCLYCRDLTKVEPLLDNPCVELHGAVNCKGSITLITNSVRQAMEFSDVVMVVTTATAHRSIAEQIAPYLRAEHVVVLNPGRTLGALEFRAVLDNCNHPEGIVAEAQTLLYACRLEAPGKVHVIGAKERVPLVATTPAQTAEVLARLNGLFPCFEDGKSMLLIGLENIGAIFHPSVVLFNAATIERNTAFYFYRDMTPQIASFIQKLDAERIAVGRAYGIDLMPVEDWIVYAYPGTSGNGLCERMRNNPAYHDILGPGSIFTRQLTEDIPTGIVPMRDLGRLADVKTPIMDSIITISSILLDSDFEADGRTLNNLNLAGLTVDNLIGKLR